ncbi:exodeoxyribonuclease 7 small subunit [Clostridium tepidiprofundi DSM 19306]|uniref:Exodeoxyribonuclease 7 small subunit n=1 Tax=Clostridium tepidiprofundi DSM 19306 TaxID=1121338 RepID=A0A151B7S3_9CLOT|nr:exodeoxyribonuclease VII small subunit [Clostridium tepidiprofundi]KYH35697.1 exodeoxyribonuclease 7 small subunit [Clostridium tepidiprofundi DSM 19306]
MTRNKENYESMMSELEEIVNKMQNDELTLDESIKYYEKGITLSNKLYKMINEAERKIKIINNSEEQDFNV